MNLTFPTTTAITDWITNTEYTGDFLTNARHPVCLWFWEVLREFSHENQAKLLQFVTGTSGVPSQGFGVLQGNDGNIRKFTLHGDKNVKVLDTDPVFIHEMTKFNPISPAFP